MPTQNTKFIGFIKQTARNPGQRIDYHKLPGWGTEATATAVTDAMNAGLLRMQGDDLCLTTWGRVWLREQRGETRTVPNRLKLDTGRQRICINTRWYDLTEAQVDMVTVLMKARGRWVGGKNIGERPDHTRNGMPKSVKSIVETHKRNGYRIKPEHFTP
jgi:hypothetical protein